MLLDRIPKVALMWMTAGKQKRGSPKATWRRTVDIELTEMGLTWRGDQAIVMDKTLWRRGIAEDNRPPGDNKE